MNFNQTNNNQGDVINLQGETNIEKDVKWGQYHNDHILMSENMYALVQISKSGQVCSMIGRRLSEHRVFLDDYHHAKWFDGVEEAKQWAEKQLFPEAKTNEQG